MLYFRAPSGVDPLGTHLTKKKTDIAAIASVLKQYFRDLAEPLFPVEKYHDFVESAREFVDLLWFTVFCRQIIDTHACRCMRCNKWYFSGIQHDSTVHSSQRSRLCFVHCLI